MIAEHMKRTIPIAILLALAALLAAGLYKFPAIAENTTREALAAAGIEGAFLPEPEKNWNGLHYRDIFLSEDRLDTIKSIDIRYSPFSLLFSGRVESISIDGLNLTGQWDAAKTPPLNFSGFSLPVSPAFLAGIPADRISVTQASVSALTENLGGVTLSFDGEGILKNGRMEFRFHIESGQKYLSFTAGADGIIARDYFNIDINVEEGKFDFPDSKIRATRIFGSVGMTRDKSGPSKITAEFQAGGLSALGTPWQNASATLEISENGIQVFSEAKSVGIEGIELGLNLQKQFSGPSFPYGTLHADDGKILAGYLSQQEAFSLPQQDIDAIAAASDITVDFAVEYGEGAGKIKYRTVGNGISDTAIHEIGVK